MGARVDDAQKRGNGLKKRLSGVLGFSLYAADGMGGFPLASHPEIIARADAIALETLRVLRSIHQHLIGACEFLDFSDLTSDYLLDVVHLRMEQERARKDAAGND